MTKRVEVYLIDKDTDIEYRIEGIYWGGERGQRTRDGQMTPDYGPEIESFRAFNLAGDEVALPSNLHDRAEELLLQEGGSE